MIWLRKYSKENKLNSAIKFTEVFSVKSFYKTINDNKFISANNWGDIRILDVRESDIEDVFCNHIIMDSKRIFKRSTWEFIYQYIHNLGAKNNEQKRILTYFKNKTIGYDSNGILQKAFKI